MADVRPFRALHYDPARVDLADVTAPPYDVIDDAGRAELLAPLSLQRRRARPARGPTTAPTSTSTRPSCSAPGGRRASSSSDDEPTIWALEQDYTAPDGGRRTRRGFMARIAVTDYGAGLIRPHERTQPGPEGGPPAPDPGDRPQPLADLRAPLRRRLERDRAGASTRTALLRDHRRRRHRPPRLADRRPAVHDAVAAVLEGSELLIADGHHRYETARTYADEVGAAEGDDARFTLACLVSLEDPGLSVFATHRLLHDLDAERRVALRDRMFELFELEPIDDPADLVPPDDYGTIAFGYMDAFHRQPYRLRLKDEAVLEAALPGSSEAFRTLDAAALEALILKGPLGMSTDDIAAKRGLSYCSDFGEAVAPARPRGGRGRVLPPPDARSSRSAPSPTPARRCRRSRPTSSRSCSPGSPSTRCLRAAGPREDEDLHAQGRRRHDRASGTAAGGRSPTTGSTPTARSTRRARRSASPARSAAPSEAEVAADILDLQRDLFVAGAELAAAPEAADRLEDGVSRITDGDGRRPRARRSTATWTASSCRRSS